MAAEPEELYCSDDQAIQATNDDATVCKKYAVSKGYWSDDYVKYFCRTIERRSPEINRGYYARVMSVRNLLIKFLTMFTTTDCQIISIGAGFDSSYWVLRSLGHTPKLYIEVDYGDVTVRKCHFIKTKKDLLEVLQKDGGPLAISNNEVLSPIYKLLSCDLRHLQQLDEKLKDIGIDYSLPTFFVAECVLVYMDPNVSQQLIKWAGSNFKTAAFLNYDPINPNDLFGVTMKRNLASLGCSLLGIEACPDLQSQCSRYTNNEWSTSWSHDMLDVYDTLSQEEITRIEKLDLLDERILLEQLLQHYTLSCGINDIHNKGLRNLTIHNSI